MPGNNYPKLHNAMWPGLVGKGPDSEPPIDLDTMLKLTAAARSNGGKFEGVDLFLADPHTSIDSTKDDIQRLADKIAGYGLAVGSVVAPVWPPVGGGSAMGSAGRARQICRYGRQGLPHCAAAERHRNSQVWSRPESIPRPGCMIGRPIRPTTRNRSPRHSARRAMSPNDMASAWRLKAKSAGAECTAGRTWSTCWRRSGGRRPWASRPIWPTRCSTRWDTTPRSTASFPRTTTGPTQKRSTRRSKSSRTRSDRGRSISMSPRTTQPSKAKARTTRRDVTAWSATRMANSILRATPATGCATTRASSPKSASTSAGTGACSRTPR